MIGSAAEARRRVHLIELTRSLAFQRSDSLLPVQGSNRAVQIYDDENDRCIKVCINTLRDDPADAISFFQRGVAYRNKGFYAVALSDLRKAVRCDPTLAAALHELARIELCCPVSKFRDLGSAITNATKACLETDYATWPYPFTLACAHAESQDYGIASRLAADAESLVPESDLSSWHHCLQIWTQHLLEDLGHLGISCDSQLVGLILDHAVISGDLIGLIPKQFAFKQLVVPLAMDRWVKRIAVADKRNLDLEQLLRVAFNGDVQLIEAPRRSLERALGRYYHR
jgi:tetratricopeptide (TPR) repeat protein